jgi:uncharacterized protein (TIGR03083 family)
MDAVGIYGRARRRLTGLVGGLDATACATPVAGCPGWTVHSVVSHLAGVSADFVAGRTEGAATPPWTARQVAERHDASTSSVLAEWTASAVELEAMIATVPALFRVAMDVLTHEWDVRGALGVGGDKADDDVDAVLQEILGGLAGRFTGAGSAPLRVLGGTDEWILGGAAADPGATVEVDPFELFRAVFGRRSEAQLRSWRWSGDPEPYLPLLTVFPPSAVDLAE